MKEENIVPPPSSRVATITASSSSRAALMVYHVLFQGRIRRRRLRDKNVCSPVLYII